MPEEKQKVNTTVSFSGGPVVEDEDVRLLEHGAADGHPLFLPAGEAHAPLGHLGVKAALLLPDELHGILEGGTIIACAPHEELLRTCQVYRDIYNSQMKGAEQYA